MEKPDDGSDRSPIEFLLYLQIIKHLPRTGWLRTIDRPESVGSHSFSLAHLAGLAPPGLDKQKCMFIGLCHDLAEGVVGDIAPLSNISKERKHQLERAGFQYVVGLIEACSPEYAVSVHDAWMDYEEGRTAEGRFMKEMDKLECMVQMFGYEVSTYGEKDLTEFLGLQSKMVSAQGRSWLAALQRMRAAHAQKGKRKLPVIFVNGDLDTDKRIQLCNFLAAELDLQHVSLGDILRDKSHEEGFVHAQFLSTCLSDDIPIPERLLSALVEAKIEEVWLRTRQWILISGYPTSRELHDFTMNVQRSSYILTCSGIEAEQAYDSNLNMAGWQDDRQSPMFAPELPQSIVKKITCIGQSVLWYDQAKVAVEEYIVGAGKVTASDGSA